LINSSIYWSIRILVSKSLQMPSLNWERPDILLGILLSRPPATEPQHYQYIECPAAYKVHATDLQQSVMPIPDFLWSRTEIPCKMLLSQGVCRQTCALNFQFIPLLQVECENTVFLVKISLNVNLADLSHNSHPLRLRDRLHPGNTCSMLITCFIIHQNPLVRNFLPWRLVFSDNHPLVISILTYEFRFGVIRTTLYRS
jgi:hypothetical protein